MVVKEIYNAKNLSKDRLILQNIGITILIMLTMCLIGRTFLLCAVRIVFLKRKLSFFFKYSLTQEALNLLK